MGLPPIFRPCQPVAVGFSDAERRDVFCVPLLFMPVRTLCFEIIRSPDRMTSRHNSLFEELAACIGCLYLSDMKFPPYNERAKTLLRTCFSAEKYSLTELSDLYRYLYNRKRCFSSYEEARAAFQNSKPRTRSNIGNFQDGRIEECKKNS